MVAVAPGAAAPPDDPSGDGTLESLFEGRGDAAARAGSGGRARSGAAEARTTMINLSGAADAAEPVPERRVSAVPIRRIVGARPPSGRWPARARRTARVGGWLVGAATVGVGLLALWVLLFTSVSGGDVWLGRPLSHDEGTGEDAGNPAGTAGTLRPSSTPRATPTSIPAKPPATAAKPAAPTDSSGKGGGGSSSASSRSGSGSGSGGSGRNGADDPPGDDSGGTRATAPTSGDDSGSSGSGSGSSGSDSGSGGSDSSGGSGSSGGGDGSDD